MCNVCCEDFTFHNKEIKCQYCDFKACRSCHKTYVFGSNKDMHCMACKKEWTDEYISDNFTKTFYNKDLKHHRERCLFEHEKTLLPEAQECLGRYDEYKKVVIMIEFIDKEKGKILNRYSNGEKVIWYDYNQLRTRGELWNGRYHGARLNVTSPRKRIIIDTKPSWTWACPMGTCRGFLCNKNTCGTCKKEFCADCYEEKHDNPCDPDKKKTIKLLKKDSRPCPKCQCVIHKIDGCDQMWCPDCKTAFSWEKGTIETTSIHNPHYYEYLRNTQGFVPRNTEDTPCRDRMPVYPRRLDYTCEYRDMYNEYFRIYTHGIYALSERWGDAVIESLIGEDELKFLRVQYLANDIDVNKWKKELQKNHKAARKCKEIQQVFQALRQVGMELFWDTETDPSEIIIRAHDALLYFNNAFKQISLRFNCIAPYFDYHDADWLEFNTRRYQVGC